MKHKEDDLAQDISDYIALKYPKVIYRFDVGASVPLSMFQAKKMKKLQGKYSKGFPDLTIFQPNKRYSGLFIELKISSPFLKDGRTLKKNEHLQNQSNFIDNLKDKGYYATFGVGLKDCIEIIDEYLND